MDTCLVEIHYDYTHAGNFGHYWLKGATVNSVQNISYTILKGKGKELEKRKKTRHVSSMIPSARPNRSYHYFYAVFVLFGDILKSGDGRTDLRTKTTCNYNDHYRPGLWVGRVDQFLFFCRQLTEEIYNPFLFGLLHCNSFKLCSTFLSSSSMLQIHFFAFDKKI